MRRRGGPCGSRGALRRTRLAFVLVLALVALGGRAAKAKEHELPHRGAAPQPAALRLLPAEPPPPPPPTPPPPPPAPRAPRPQRRDPRTAAQGDARRCRGP